MIRKTLFILLFLTSLEAKEITPSDVYSQVVQIQKELHVLFKHFSIAHNHNKTEKKHFINEKLKPRHAWQKSYEIMLKINILRSIYKLPKIDPVNMEPVLNINPVLTYEQTQRILTELNIFKSRLGIDEKVSSAKKYSNKSPLDVYNELSLVSIALDELNGASFNTSNLFSEVMRVYGDVTLILRQLNISDDTLPPIKNSNSDVSVVFEQLIKILIKIRELKNTISIDSINFNGFEQKNLSDAFSLNEMVIAEIQPIKAYIGLQYNITPSGQTYFDKTPADVEQMLGWILRKISLIETISGVKR